MELEGLNTYDDLQSYLLERKDYATNGISKVNTSFTKKQIWNMWIGDCKRWKGQELPIRTKHILLKNVKRDFGMNV